MPGTRFVLSLFRLVEPIQGLVDALIARMRVSPNHFFGLMAGERLDGSRLGTGLRHFRYRRVPQHVWDHQLGVQLGSDDDATKW